MRRIAIISLGLLWSGVYAQEQPSTLLFRPLIAAVYEARFGTLYQFPPQRIRLDIGYSVDICRDSVSGLGEWALGIDGFTYTRLRSEANLKFPVETVDYMFGINGSWRTRVQGTVWALRIRASHISAHLADGVADSAGRLSPRPFVYSREFIDMIGACTLASLDLRAYAGVTILVSNKALPKPVSRVIPQLGLEWQVTVFVPLVLGVDYRLVGIDNTFIGSIAAQFNVTVMQRDKYRLAVCGYYYSGYSIHGMFYDIRDRYSAVGFQVLF